MARKKLGKVQKAIIAAFDAKPEHKFTVSELAARAYPAGVTPSRKDHTSRAVNALVPILGLRKERRALRHGFGWEHTYIRRAAFDAMLAHARRERWTPKPTNAAQSSAQKEADDAP